jgi:hypothetical protein
MKQTIFKILFLSALCIFNFSCKKEITAETEIDSQTEQNKIEDINITAKDIKKLNYTEYVLSDLAEAKTQDWVKFQELITHIEVLKKGDLSFFQGDKTLLETFLTDLKNEIPDQLNEPSILVRLNVLENTALKLEGIRELNNLGKNEILNYIKDVLVSYTNIVFQINKKLEKDSQNITKP